MIRLVPVVLLRVRACSCELPVRSPHVCLRDERAHTNWPKAPREGTDRETPTRAATFPAESSAFRRTERLIALIDLLGNSTSQCRAPSGAGVRRDLEDAMLDKRLFAAAVLFAFATTAAAQETARVAVAPESKLWIEGTSNLHGWSCKATSLEAAVELDAATATQVSVAPPKSLKRVQVKVPVRSIKCGHGGMDDNLYKALKADDSPDISYIMATFDAASDEAKDSFTLHTVGTLTIAGRENNLAM